MPEVSIVLPTYNGARFLRQSVESVIQQNFTDWELIIVNDCSNDSTHDIACEYSLQDRRIKVIDNVRNEKLPESLNIGFRASSGRYLTWTSDDNMYLPDAIGTMHKYLKENTDYKMVCAGTNYIDEDGRKTGLSITYDPHTIYASDSVGACFMYERQVISEVGEYDTDLFCVEDYDYWLRILRRYGKIGYINRMLYLYRIQSHSLTATKIQKVRSQRARMQRKYLTFLTDSIRRNGDDILPLAVSMLSDAADDFDAVKKYFAGYSDEIASVVKVPDEGPLIVYGAGNIGNSAYTEYGDRIKYYADGDPSKYGKYICHVKIISFEEMKSMINDYAVVIAVGSARMPEIMRAFAAGNISSYSVFIG